MESRIPAGMSYESAVNFGLIHPDDVPRPGAPGTQPEAPVEYGYPSTGPATYSGATLGDAMRSAGYVVPSPPPGVYGVAPGGPNWPATSPHDDEDPFDFPEAQPTQVQARDASAAPGASPPPGMSSNATLGMWARIAVSAGAWKAARMFKDPAMAKHVAREVAAFQARAKDWGRLGKYCTSAVGTKIATWCAKRAGGRLGLEALARGAMPAAKGAGFLAKGIGRAVPGLNIAIAALDCKQFYDDMKDPKASTGKKIVSGVTAGLSVVAATNIPVVSQVAGILSTGASAVRDFFF